VNRSPKERWVAGPEETPFELPPYGFLALGEEGFIAYSANVSANRVDFCRTEAYMFLDVRSANPRTVEGITTDGSVILLRSGEGRPDLVLVGARQLTLRGEEYRLSERGDLRLTHRSENEIELTVMDTDNGKPAHVTWPVFGPAWKGRFQVTELQDGAWRESRCQVTTVRGGLQMSRALPGVTYRISASGG